MSEFGEIEVIEDINKSIYWYVVERWKIFLLPAGILIISGIFIMGSDAAIWLIGGGVFWVLLGAVLGKLRVMEAFMRQFALRNHFTYVGEVDPESAIGSLFKRGHSREISNAVLGARGGHDLRFFFFYYTVGSGKHKKTYSYTVCEIKMKGASPDIIVESRDDWDFQSYAKEHQKEILMESSFRDHFAVWAPEDFEIETFEIFTPDVMSELINRAKQYNFEFIEDRMYVFRFGEITKKAELEEFLKLTEYLISALGQKVFRLSDDVRALKEAEGRRAV